MAPQYVPAWQRLGLKLKNQPAIEVQTSSPLSTSNAGITPRKRKFSEGTDSIQDSPSVNPKKKSRSSLNHLDSPQSNGIKSFPARDSNTPPESRRKSVTFSADTKAEDGDSSKRLVQAAYASRLARVTGLEEQDIQAAENELNKTATPSVNGKAAQSNGTVKDKKAIDTNGIKTNGDVKSKQSKNPTAQPSSKVELARQKKKRESAIQYLDEYHNNKEIWKFNKSRQVSVLKMAVDVDSIPPEHDEALKSYLKGLQGEGPRRDLRVKAQEVLNSISEVEAPSVIPPSPSVLRARMILEVLGSEPDEKPLNRHTNKDSSTEEKEKKDTATGISKPLIDRAANITPNGLSISLKTNGMTPAEHEIGTIKKRRLRKKKKRNLSDSDSSSSDDSSSSSDSD